MKITDYPLVSGLEDGDVLLIDGARGTKTLNGSYIKNVSEVSNKILNVNAFENIIPLSGYKQTVGSYYGITIVNNGDGSFTVNGTSTQQSGVVITKSWHTDASAFYPFIGKKVTFSSGNDNEDMMVAISFYDSDKNELQSFHSWNNENTDVLKSGISSFAIYTYLPVGKTYINEIIRPTMFLTDSIGVALSNTEAPAWIKGNSYPVNYFVIYRGDLYKCKLAHTSSDSIKPTNTTYWYHPTTIGEELRYIRSTFQAGVDTLYNACVNKGQTPSSSTPSAIASAIAALVKPSGTKSITSNGTHDVSAYASASVSVPSSVYHNGDVIINNPSGYVTKKTSRWYKYVAVYSTGTIECGGTLIQTSGSLRVYRDVSANSYVTGTNAIGIY